MKFLLQFPPRTLFYPPHLISHRPKIYLAINDRETLWTLNIEQIRLG